MQLGDEQNMTSLNACCLALRQDADNFFIPTGMSSRFSNSEASGIEELSGLLEYMLVNGLSSTYSIIETMFSRYCLGDDHVIHC